MQINIQREELLKPLSLVAGAVERRQTLPILANILIELKGKELKLTGTDLEIEVIVQTKVKPGEDGAATIPARKLLDICRTLPADTKIDLKLDNGKVIIKAGRSRFTLATLPTTDFPNLEKTEWDQTFTLPQGVFKRLLARTQFCMAQQDVRYYLNGLLLELENKQARAVATDGHRMAMSDIKLKQAMKETKQAIIPRKGVLEISRLLDDSDDDIEVRLSPNHLQLAAGDLVFTTKLIDGRFPDYTKVVPVKQTKKLKIDRDNFKEALTRVAILSNEKYRGVRFNLSNGNLKITAHNPEQEEAQEELTVDYEGDELEIGFNVNYIIDAVSALSVGTIEISLDDANSSCVIANPEATHTQYIVMPMRL